MPSLLLYTYKDAIDHGIDFLGGDPSALARQNSRHAVLSAYRNLSKAYNWSYLYQEERIVTNAPQTTGTVEFDYTGGAYERMLTITGGTWPEWAPYGEIIINNIRYPVSERKTSTILTLSVRANPGSDVASGTAYTLDRNTYPLPIDCLSVDRMLNLTNRQWLLFAHARESVDHAQYNQITGQPRIFSIQGDPNYLGTMSVRFYPSPDAAYPLAFLYHRMPRQLNVEDYSTGTVSSTSGTATITGSGTAWSDVHVGCVLRFSSGSAVSPTGRVGAHPPHRERVVTAVGSGTSLTVDQAMDVTLSGVKYILSDPVDVDEHTMLSAFQRGIEVELATNRRMKERDQVRQSYLMELRMGMASDSRCSQPRSIGDGVIYRQRPADMPLGSEIP